MRRQQQGFVNMDSVRILTGKKTGLSSPYGSQDAHEAHTRRAARWPLPHALRKRYWSCRCGARSAYGDSTRVGEGLGTTLPQLASAGGTRRPTAGARNHYCSVVRARYGCFRTRAVQRHAPLKATSTPPHSTTRRLPFSCRRLAGVRAGKPQASERSSWVTWKSVKTRISWSGSDWICREATFSC